MSSPNDEFAHGMPGVERQRAPSWLRPGGSPLVPRGSTPATTRTVEIPAEYETMSVRKLVRKAEETRTPIAAEYRSVSRQELDKDGHMEWRSILCETNMTNTRISQIQEALRDAGHDPGPIDGEIGQETMRAVNAFQRQRGLPVDRYLNIETLDALGVAAN